MTSSAVRRISIHDLPDLKLRQSLVGKTGQQVSRSAQTPLPGCIGLDLLEEKCRKRFLLLDRELASFSDGMV